MGSISYFAARSPDWADHAACVPPIQPCDPREWWGHGHWPPLAAGIFLIVIALLLRIASRGMQAGLHGLKWPIPSDGMAMLERQQVRQNGTLWIWRLRLVGPAAASSAVVFLAAGSQPERWLVWLAAGFLFTLPALLVAYRQS